MNAPFAESIVGSWRFIRSTHPNFKPEKALIYHFTSDGKVFWEMPNGTDKRSLVGLRYSISHDVLTFIYQDKKQILQAKEQTHRLSYAEDGSVEFPNFHNEYIWWMVRLAAPEPFSIAFVGSDGLLQKIAPKTGRKVA